LVVEAIFDLAKNCFRDPLRRVWVYHWAFLVGYAAKGKFEYYSIPEAAWRMMRGDPDQQADES
jgi:hypothetical protein